MNERRYTEEEIADIFAHRQPATVTRRHFWLPIEIGRTVQRTATIAAAAGVGILAATAQRLKAWSRLGRQQIDSLVTRLFGSR